MLPQLFHPRILFLLVLGVLSCVTIVHILLYKRDPRAALLWIGLCVVFPGAGPFFYLLLGVNRIRTHARRLHHRGNWSHGTPIDRRLWPSGFLGRENAYLEPLRHLGNSVTDRPLLAGNRLAVLENGETAYPAMLEAISRAKHAVYLSSYIFNADETGRKFASTLAQVRSRGVRVRVLVDGVGEKYSWPLISRVLREQGVPCSLFLPIRWNPLRLHLNLRNHRKLLVVDGNVGFIGGMNIRDDHWVVGGSYGNPTRDLHFRVEGPAVMEMEEVFLEDWYFATRESLPWRHKGPVKVHGRSVCRVLSDGPNEGIERIQALLLGVTAWARKSLRIMTPYFIPDRVLIAGLTQAALRGVEVELILPQKNNLPFVAWASRAYLWELLQRGIKVYEQPGSFVHSKALVVDGSYALVGSSNLDPRSLRLNFECNMEVYDPVFARALEVRMEAVKTKSHRLTLEKVNSDPFPIRLRNAACKLFSPYL